MTADGSTAFTTTSQSAFLSSDVIPAASNLQLEPQSDVTCHLVDIHNDVAAVVDNIVLSVAASEGDMCTTTTSAAYNTSDCHFTIPVCSTIVSASTKTVSDGQFMEVHLNGN